MNHPVLNATLGAAGSGAPAAASIHAVLLDPGNDQQGEVWFRLDRGTPSFTWSPDLRRAPASSAQVIVIASLTECSGAAVQLAPVVFAAGASWQLTRRRPFTVWALPGELDWSELESVTVTLGVAAASRLDDIVRLELRQDEPPPSATLFAERREDLAVELVYRWRGGGELSRPMKPVPAAFLDVPPPPPTGELTVAPDAETAAELGVSKLEATLVDADGARHARTWSAGELGEPWTLRLPAAEGGVAGGRLGYRVSFVGDKLPAYASPEATVLGPGPLRLAFFGAARFAAAASVFDGVDSFRVATTAPVAATSSVATARDPVAWVALPGDVPGAPLPGERPVLRWRTSFELGDGNSVIVRGEGTNPAVDIAPPLGVKTFSFLPVWESSDTTIRRIHLSYRSLEVGAGWKIEGAAESADLQPGDGVLTTRFPVRDPSRAAVVYSGRVITSQGSVPLPEAVVAGASMAVGGAPPWLSVSVDPSMVDWRLFDEVTVELTRDGTPEVAGSLRFTAADGPRAWGFFGASVAQRIYSVEAIYRGAGGERSLTRSGETAALFVLPAAPEAGR